MSRGKIFAVICLVVAGTVFFLSQNKKHLPVGTSSPVVPANESSSLSPEEQNTVESSIHQNAGMEPENFRPRQGSMQARRIRQPQEVGRSQNLNQIDKKLQSSELFENSHWNLWQGVRAIAASEVQRAPETYLTKVSGYYLIEDNEYQAQEELVGQAEPLIYYNKRTHQAGVVTGVLKVTLRKSGLIESLSTRYKLQVEGAFPHLNLFMVRSRSEPVDLQTLQKQLLAEADVAQVEVEILSRQYEKK